MTDGIKRKRRSRIEALNFIDRRQFLKYAGVAGGMILMGMDGGSAMSSTTDTRISLLRTEERKTGPARSIRALGVNPVKSQNVLIKPNFNTADPAPGSTHNDTLVGLVETLWDMGAKSIRLGERSYPPTKSVMADKGVLPLMKDLDVEVVDFDRLDAKDWVKVHSPNHHWRDGFRVARPILEAECLVSTCCLKTHQYGGVFTMSLKLHVGVVPTTRHGYDYMKELHSSPHQQKMIAEINAAFKPALIVLDGIDAFVDGGPMTGKRAKGSVFLAGTDRVAIDATGVAILKHLGSNRQIMDTPIFDQEQIARAAELGIGVDSPSKIALIAADKESADYRDRIAKILNGG